MAVCQSILGSTPNYIFVEWGRERKWPRVSREARLSKSGGSRGDRRRVRWEIESLDTTKVVGAWEGCTCVRIVS